MAAFGAATFQDIAASLSGHPLPEPVVVFAFPV